MKSFFTDFVLDYKNAKLGSTRVKLSYLWLNFLKVAFTVIILGTIIAKPAILLGFGLFALVVGGPLFFMWATIGSQIVIDEHHERINNEN